MAESRSDRSVVDTEFEFKSCYGCGAANAHGLKLPLKDSRQDDDWTVLDVTIPEHFSGWPGIVHGGVTAAILDEIVGWHCWSALGVMTVTGELSVRYEKPVPTESTLTIRARGELPTGGGRSFAVNGEIRGAGGEPLATATARMVLVEQRPTAP